MTLTSRMALEFSAPGRSCLLAKMSRVAPDKRWGVGLEEGQQPELDVSSSTPAPYPLLQTG